MKVLFVTSDFPFPPNHGGRLDVYKRIQKFHNMGWEIYLFSTISSGKDTLGSVDIPIKIICTTKRDVSFLNLLRLSPFQIASRKIKISDLEPLRDITFDLGIYEGDYVSHYLESFHCKRNILRVHNDETHYFLGLSRSVKGIKKLYYGLESLKFKIREFLDNSKFDERWYISNQEFEKNSRDSTSYFVPPDYEITNSFTKPIASKTVLFVGSLFMDNNIEGLKWYLDNIHRRVADSVENYLLVVAGNSRGRNLNWLSNYSHLEFIDTPEDLNEIYARSSVFINPMLNGAGVKLKTIEAIKKCLPLISTEVGSEGTGLINKQHAAICDDSDSFSDAVIEFLNSPDTANAIAQNAFEFVKSNYDSKRHIHRIEKILENS